jgi:Flp pilus assembly protein TadD/outer membrane protein OmpA-like peptidoglycan-associated protein
MHSAHKRFFKFVTLALAMVLVGCNGLGKMSKYAENIKYTVEPSPLIVQGDSVDVTIRGNFPGKYFYKKGAVELTPTITSASGSMPLKMAGFQGEDAAGNYTVIPYETGKDFFYHDKVAYKPDMATSQLMLNVLGKQGEKKQMPFDPVKLADGVITTPYLVQSDDKVLLGKDNFVRITSKSMAAQVNFPVASSSVAGGQLTEVDNKAMASFIKANASNDRIALKGVVVDAYASPEGEMDMNENLADDRAAAAKNWLAGVLNSNKVAGAKDAAFFALNPRGEDWTGFERAMQASTFADKDLVLRVLTMYPDLNKRESEIKNMAATYQEIREDILPQLRRSEVMLNYEEVGYSDEELTTNSRSMPDSLTADELLRAATLTTDMNEQLRIYQECVRVHPTDWRGPNNVGYVHMMQNKLNEAEQQFQRANSVQDNAVSTNNLGVCARMKGDRNKAAELYKKAMSAGPEVKYNLGIVNLQNGDYAGATANMAGTNDFNSALAKLLGGDAAGAQRTLEQSADKDTAEGHYLMAVIGARQNNGDLVRSQLGQAVAKDPKLGEKAKADLEFRNFKDNLGI